MNLLNLSLTAEYAFAYYWVILIPFREGGNRGVNLPSPYFLSQFLPPPYFFEPISPSSLNGYVSFSPSSLLFPPISPSSQLFLGHFSLLPILFLPPPSNLFLAKQRTLEVGRTMKELSVASEPKSRVLYFAGFILRLLCKRVFSRAAILVSPKNKMSVVCRPQPSPGERRRLGKAEDGRRLIFQAKNKPAALFVYFLM